MKSDSCQNSTFTAKAERSRFSASGEAWPFTSSTSAGLKNDIGYFIDATKSVSEVQQAVCALSDS